jgi:hypothetical protein
MLSDPNRLADVDLAIEHEPEMTGFLAVARTNQKFDRKSERIHHPAVLRDRRPRGLITSRGGESPEYDLESLNSGCQNGCQ